jgi:ribosome-binding factor A
MNDSRSGRGDTPPPGDRHDPVDPSVYFSPAADPRVQRKARQLCQQVALALDHALAWACSDPVLNALSVLAVEPAPDASRLLVRLAVTDPECGATLAEILARLSAARGLLRTEIAAAIHRKGVPELVFRIEPPGGGR